MTPIAEVAQPIESPPTLSRVSFFVSYAIVLTIFLFLDAPFANPFDIDRSILWSYAPIPFLVLFFLALEKKVRLVSFVLATVNLTVLKFGTTYLLAMTLWVATGPPVHRPRAERIAPHARAAAALEETAPAATPIAPDRVGTIAGRVLSGNVPLEGAIVYVAHGLEEIVFARPAAPTVLEDRGGGLVLPIRAEQPLALPIRAEQPLESPFRAEQPLEPAAVVTQTFQPLLLRSADGHLHTAVATKERGETLFNRPLLSAGTEQVVTFRHETGWMHVRCSVHPGERAAALLVLSHPFWTRSAADGSFELRGVPFGRLELAASRSGEETTTTLVEHGAAATSGVGLAFAAPMESASR